MNTYTSKQKQALIGIRCGWIGALLSVLATMTIALLYSPFYWLDVVIMAILGVGIFNKSRVAAWLLLAYFMVSKIMVWSVLGADLLRDIEGWSNLFTGLMFICLYAAAVWGTTQWQREAKAAQGRIMPS
ncbi:MAG: hypothetical protein KBC57_09880 [Neisseriaceae bacterium]|nr:hypothetical protein [Neisseriaceae bacterium]MBP6862652.1 hypothetical protein [Neisseriaceae bacterium]